jgi:hypothetical protein
MIKPHSMDKTKMGVFACGGCDRKCLEYKQSRNDTAAWYVNCRDEHHIEYACSEACIQVVLDAHSLMGCRRSIGPSASCEVRVI